MKVISATGNFRALPCFVHLLKTVIILLVAMETPMDITVNSVILFFSGLQQVEIQLLKAFISLTVVHYKKMLMETLMFVVLEEKHLQY